MTINYFSQKRKKIFKLSWGEICVADFIPPANSESLDSYSMAKGWFQTENTVYVYPCNEKFTTLE